MQRVIENFPEFKKGERNTSKHFNLLEEMRGRVDKGKLYEVSELEQELVTGADSRSKHLKSITDLIDGAESIDNKEALRLYMLYSLRYENDEKVLLLRDKLRQKVG